MRKFFYFLFVPVPKKKLPQIYVAEHFMDVDLYNENNFRTKNVVKWQFEIESERE
jgi:hypothetical protein